MDTKSCDVSKETAFPDPHGWYSFYVHRSSVIGNWESVLRRLIVQKRRECLKRLWKADPPSGSDCTTVLLYFLALTWYKSLVAPWNHSSGTQVPGVWSGRLWPCAEGYPSENCEVPIFAKAVVSWSFQMWANLLRVLSMKGLLKGDMVRPSCQGGGCRYILLNVWPLDCRYIADGMGLQNVVKMYE